MQFVSSRRFSWSPRVQPCWIRLGRLLALQRTQARSAPSSGNVSPANLLLVSVQRRATKKTIEQRYAIKFCATPNESLPDTHQMIWKTYEDSALFYSQVSGWLKLFKFGREEVADDPRSERPSISKNEQIESENHALLSSSTPRVWFTKNSYLRGKLFQLRGSARQIKKKDRSLSKRDHRYLATTSWQHS